MLIWQALRYAWVASRGYRLRPWANPYLRWRIETYFGGHANQLTAREFFCLLWQNRHQLAGFLRWTAEMRRYMRQLVLLLFLNFSV